MRTRNKLFIFYTILTFLFYGCKPFIRLNTVHPDSDKTVSFTITRGTVIGPVDEINLEIEGETVATQPDEPLEYLGGPYHSFSNRKLNFRAMAGKSGRNYVNSNWVYIANPKGQFSHESPNGSNNGYPDNSSEQTGANLYRLDKSIVLTHANNAVMEFSNSTGLSIIEVYGVADNLVAAVAFYVDQHMSWRADSANRRIFRENGYSDYTPGWDFPQPADLTLTISGNLDNATPNDDFQGDCEDHAILRAALLRALGFASWGIWDAIDQNITHEYNIVMYEGAYRIMDYGLIGRWLNSHTWNSHKTHYGWNEDHGPRGVNSTNNNFIKNNTDNFPGDKPCDGAWNYNKYYRIKCK